MSILKLFLKGILPISLSFAIVCTKNPVGIVNITDTQAVERDKNALIISFAAGDSASSVTKNVGLPTNGTNGSIISWSTSDSSRITIKGIVNRPAADASISLIAKISKGAVFEEKVFVLTVKAVISQDYFSLQTGNWWIYNCSFWSSSHLDSSKYAYFKILEKQAISGNDAVYFDSIFFVGQNIANDSLQMIDTTKLDTFCLVAKGNFVWSFYKNSKILEYCLNNTVDLYKQYWPLTKPLWPMWPSMHSYDTTITDLCNVGNNTSIWFGAHSDSIIALQKNPWVDETRTYLPKIGFIKYSFSSKPYINRYSIDIVDYHIN